tara:strand:- start:6 stop:425 length:420 start_codon:yes stop_codon:yes gene_type:complete
MIAFIVLLIINIYVYVSTYEPENLRIVKERYEILRKNIDGTEFEKLKQCIPITAHYGLRGTVGYNLNKGSEIGLCIDGEVNEIFHVLIHELTHSMVDEYNHSVEYWEKYNKLRDICVRLNIYEPIPTETPFCGMHIQDK